MKILFLFFVLVSAYTAPAQSGAHSLQAGDILPDIILTRVHNYPTTSVKLSDVKSELIVLDFWGTFCGSCIAAFPKLIDIKKTLGDSLAIFLVNKFKGDTEEKLQSFFAKSKIKYGYVNTLPYVVQDTVLEKYFYFTGVPQYVWLDKNRKILSITGGQYFNLENLRGLLQGSDVKMEQKNDALRFNPDSSLLGEPLSALPKYNYRSVFTGPMVNYGTVSGYTAVAGTNTSRFYAINDYVSTLYRRAYPLLFEGIRLDQVIIGSEITGDFEHQFKGTNVYCYDLLAPSASEETLRDYLKNDLQRLFRVTPMSEKRLIEFWILSIEDLKKIRPSANKEVRQQLDKMYVKKFLTGSDSRVLAGAINRFLGQTVLNETNIQYKLDMKFPDDIYEYDENMIIQFLKTKGFRLSREKRWKDVVVFKNVD